MPDGGRWSTGMIQHRTMLVSADNSGARKLQCIRVRGGHRKRYARLGDLVTCVVKDAMPRSGVKKSDIVHAVVVRTRKEQRRPDGGAVRFDENAVVIVDPESGEPKATRIFGPVARELRSRGYAKIVSLAPEVV